MRSIRSLLSLTVAVLSAACASGGGGPASGPSTSRVPEVRGFDGGTQVSGGFTNTPSAVQDSVIDAPRVRVWAVLPAVFETLGIEPSTVSSSTYTIGNEGARTSRIEGSTRLSQYLDCGIGILGPNADRYEVTLQLLIQLGQQPGGTLVRTTLDAYARPRDSAGEPLHCASQRTLERRVVELIAEQLRSTPMGPGNPSEGAPSREALSAMTGRIPVSGDVLRVECRLEDLPSPLVGQGRFLGFESGLLRLQVDSRGRTVTVPPARVVRVQVQEVRSRAFLGGLLGALLGGAAGAYYGANELYDPESRRLHYGQGTFTVLGGAVGTLGGFLVGTALGALIRSETWHEAPPEWAVRVSTARQQAASGSGQTAIPGAGPCPSFEDG